MFAHRDIAQGQEPHHTRVGDRELARLDVGKDAQEGMFSRAGIDVDAVTGYPGEYLRLSLHPEKGVRGRFLNQFLFDLLRGNGGSGACRISGGPQERQASAADHHGESRAGAAETGTPSAWPNDLV